MLVETGLLRGAHLDGLPVNLKRLALSKIN